MKIPASHSKTFSMKPHPAGKLIFNDESQDNVHQGTLDEAGQPTSNKKGPKTK